jgi:hypothetical protein
MISQAIKYDPIPGTPPGKQAIKKARQNQNGEIPKNSPNPPHTPAKIRLLVDLRNGLFGLMCNLRPYSAFFTIIYAF